MNTSRFIARLIGPLFLVMGLGTLIEGDLVRALSQEFLSNVSLIYLAGMLTLVGGLAIVNVHNVWEANWRVIITILGWLSVIGGVIRLLLPEKVQALGASMLTHPHAMIISGAVILVVGVILCWTGYELAGEDKPARKPKPKPKAASAAAKPKSAKTARAAAKPKARRTAAKPKPRKAAAKSRARAAASRSTAKRTASRKPAKRARPARKPRRTVRKRR